MTISSGDSKGLMGCKDQTVHSNKYHFPHLYWNCYVIVDSKLYVLINPFWTIQELIIVKKYCRLTPLWQEDWGKIDVYPKKLRGM